MNMTFGKQVVSRVVCSHNKQQVSARQVSNMCICVVLYSNTEVIWGEFNVRYQHACRLMAYFLARRNTSSICVDRRRFREI